MYFKSRLTQSLSGLRTIEDVLTMLSHVNNHPQVLIFCKDMYMQVNVCITESPPPSNTCYLATLCTKPTKYAIVDSKFNI